MSFSQNNFNNTWGNPYMYHMQNAQWSMPNQAGPAPPSPYIGFTHPSVNYNLNNSYMLPQQNGFPYSPYPMGFPLQQLGNQNYSPEMMAYYQNRQNESKSINKLFVAQKNQKGKVIQISDDEKCQQKTIKGQREIKKQKQDNKDSINFELQKGKKIQQQKKEEIEKRTTSTNLQVQESQNKRIKRVTKKIVTDWKIKKQEAKRIQKKRIKKIKPASKLSKHQRMIRHMSRLRQLNAEVLTGPLFQIQAPTLTFDEEKNDWKQSLKENLLMRRYE